MQLMMYIGNDLIEAVPVNLNQISQPGYLGKFKRILKQKHCMTINEAGVQPEFLVINSGPVSNAPAHSANFHVTSNGTLQAPGFL
jgi:hypothetical protein